MKRLVALILVLVGFSAGAQTPQTTNNLINPANYTGQSRTGAINGANPRDSLGCCTGSGAYVDTSGGGATYFSYSSTTVGQTIAINQALQGSGVQVGGYNYSWSYYNQDFNRGSLTSTIRLTSNTGSTLHTYSPTMGATTNGWTALSGTQTFANPYSLSGLGNLSVSFTGQDDRFWAGYYGPAVKNVNLSLNYTVDPCVANPRYSPSCAGYNNADMWSTGDLTSTYGTTFAINTALGFGNTGVRVHSVNWGYDYNIGGRYCGGWNFLGICFGWNDSYVDGNVSISRSNGTSLLTDSQRTSGENVSGSFRREVLLSSTSPDISTLGNASISLSTTGIASATPYLGFNFTRSEEHTSELQSH